MIENDIEYYVVYEKQHFENISIKHKNRKGEFIAPRKLTIRWAVNIIDFDIEIIRIEKKNEFKTHFL